MSKMRIETREGNEPKAQRGGVFAVLRTLRSQRKADEAAETAGAVEVAETAEVAEADGAAEVVEAKGGFDGTLPAPVDFNGDGIVSRNAPRQLTPSGKVLACTLAVLLVLTSWNSVSIAEARTIFVGDEPVPTAPATEDEAADDGVDDQADEGTDEASGESADEADAEGEDGEDDAVADSTVSEADMPAYLPNDLLDADKVMPSLTEEAEQTKADKLLNAATSTEEELKAALAERFTYGLDVTGGLRASDNAFHVSGSGLTLVPTLGNLAVSLAGGYLGGSESDDAVVLTFAAPYLYKNADGTYGRTNSEEEWKARGGAADDMRAVLAGELPVGWSVYTEHMGQYQKRTAEDLAAGLSGTIVLRYDGVQDEHGITERETRGQLPAGTPLPSLTASLTQNVPAAEAVTVHAGYVVCSYTAADPATEQEASPHWRGPWTRPPAPPRATTPLRPLPTTSPSSRPTPFSIALRTPRLPRWCSPTWPLWPPWARPWPPRAIRCSPVRPAGPPSS